MPTDTSILLVVVLLGFPTLFFLINRRISDLKESQKNDDALRFVSDWAKQALSEIHQTRQEMQQRLDVTNQTVNKQLSENNRSINERLDNASRVIGLVSKELGTMSEIGRQMKDLQDFLRSPKLRGNIGEQVLRDLLSQIIPKENFFLQYSFRNGNIVDAAIKTDKGIIPIDSKFPMENFKLMAQCENEADRGSAQKAFMRDVKKHIDDIAKKYILPQEGTVDFALMYIPSEPVAYEISINIPELSDYAHVKRVMCVSPNTFNYFLRVVLIGLEGKKIEEKANFILNSLKSVEMDTNRFADEFRVLTKHLNNAKNTADTATASFSQLQTRLSSLRALPGSTEDEIENLPFENSDQKLL